MADQLIALDESQFSSFKAGDEKVLTSLFRANYDRLVAAATEELGDELAHFSGRVAMQATLVTWQRRGDFGNAVGLSSAWKEAVQEESAQQQRRHAALHHHPTSSSAAPHITVMSEDEAVAQLQSALHPPAVDHAKSAQDAIKARRHSAAEHVNRVSGDKGWKGPALVLGVLVLAIVAGMRWMSSTSGEIVISKALASEDARHLETSRGQRGAVTLADSSHARIGSDSKLTLPTEFGVTLRTLQLLGSASFTVAPGQELPFQVRALNSVITATGTQFSVRAFEDDSIVTVSVDEGSVSIVVAGEKKGTDVAAGQTARMNRDGTIQMVDAAARVLALGWVTDTIVFVDTPVKTALSELIRWFDLKASLSDAALGERTVSFRIALGSSGEALSTLTNAANLAIGFDKDDKVVLSDKPVAPAKGAKTK